MALDLFGRGTWSIDIVVNGLPLVSASTYVEDYQPSKSTEYSFIKDMRHNCTFRVHTGVMHYSLLRASWYSITRDEPRDRLDCNVRQRSALVPPRRSARQYIPLGPANALAGDALADLAAPHRTGRRAGDVRWTGWLLDRL